MKTSLAALLRKSFEQSPVATEGLTHYGTAPQAALLMPPIKRKKKGKMVAKAAPKDQAYLAALIILEEIARIEEEEGVAKAEEGHQFFGNQYTDGGYQATPEQLEAGKKKAKSVAELLQTGKPFSVEEMHAIVGGNKNTVNKALSNLKLKYEKTGKGLAVVKEGGKYVIKGIVQQSDNKETTDAVAEAAVSSVKAKAVEAPPKAGTKGLNWGEGAGIKLNEPFEKISKVDADKIYKAQLHESMAYLKAEMAKGEISPEEAAKAFKISKSKNMALWMASTQGKALTAKDFVFDPPVFQTDVDMMKALQASKSEASQELEQIYQDWKTNTALAKQAAYDAKIAAAAAAAKVTKPVSPPSSSEVSGIPHFSSESSYKAMIPKNFQGIESEQEFVSSVSEYKKLAQKTIMGLAAGGGSAEDNKKAVEAALEARLASSPEFQEVSKAYAAYTSGQYSKGKSLSAMLVGQWATSSGDGYANSVALQIATKEVFGMHPSDLSYDAFENVNLTTASDEKSISWFFDDLAVQSFGMNSPGAGSKVRAAFHQFIKAQYDNTQEFFKLKGIKEVVVVRGMALGQGLDKPSLVNVKLQPASSFSTSLKTAKSFAYGHSLFLVKVPVSQVLGSYRTGFGCTGESEMVVLAHKDMKSVKVGVHAAKASSDVESLIEQVGKEFSKLTTVAKAAGETINLDDSIGNADWIKQGWDLPPYMSQEFLEQIEGDLEHFKTLPAYYLAADKGWIIDDEWSGDYLSMETVHRMIYGEEEKKKPAFKYVEHEDQCPACASIDLRKAVRSKGSTTRDWVLANEEGFANLIHKHFRYLRDSIISQLISHWKPAKKADLRGILNKATIDPEEAAEKLIQSLRTQGWAVSFMDSVKAFILKAFDAGAVSAVASIGIDMADEALSVINEGGVRYAAQRAAELVGMRIVGGKVVPNPNPEYAITETTRQGIKDLVTKAIREGYGPNELRSHLNTSYEFSMKRSRMIARTELAFSHISGNVLAWKESGVVKGKRWILADTHPETDVCDENDQEAALLMGTFHSGHFSPPAHPNCLCGLLPIVDTEWDKESPPEPSGEAS